MDNNRRVKQVTIISGKGGTGKSSLISSLAYLLRERIILADADVDAADLYLIFSPEIKEKYEYKGLKVANIDEKKCIKCGICYDSCRFDAITEDIKIDEFKCEGCGLCLHVCPEDVISLTERISGYYMKSDTRIGTFIHARLTPGEESSGLLVAQVRKTAESVAKEENKELVLIDGSPGIGCPVISSLTGSDLAIIVTEPSVSGLHDLQRILELLKQFRIPGFVVINKYDLNKDKSLEIREYCGDNFPVISTIPYNQVFNEAMINQKSVSEIKSSDEDILRIQESIETIATRIVIFLNL